MHGTGAPLGRYSSETPAEAIEAAGKVAEALGTANHVLIAGHASADGDVVGSSLALAHALRERGACVTVYNPQPYPIAFAWLAGDIEIVSTLPATARFDASVVVDAADPGRLGPHFPPPARRGVFIWLDHHRIDVPPGDVNFIDLTACAVGEQVALVLGALAHPLSPAVARCIYAAMLSDTGGFRYANTSARALRLAAALIERGVEPWRMTEAIYESQDEGKVRLLARALETLWISPCGRLGVIELTNDDLVAARALEEHVQGIVNHVRSIRGVEVAVMLRESGDQTTAVFRSRGNIAVKPIATRLGGDGHKNAATVRLPKHLVEARDEVVRAALDSFPQVPPAKRPASRTKASVLAHMPAVRPEETVTTFVRARRGRASPR